MTEAAINVAHIKAGVMGADDNEDNGKVDYSKPKIPFNGLMTFTNFTGTIVRILTVCLKPICINE